VTNVARLLRGLLPLLAASAAATAAALPAAAAVSPVTPQAVTRADQWWFTALRAPAALRAALEAGKGVTVAVLSTGVDARHQDLAGTVTDGPDLSKTGRAPAGRTGARRARRSPASSPGAGTVQAAARASPGSPLAPGSCRFRSPWSTTTR